MKVVLCVLAILLCPWASVASAADYYAQCPAKISSVGIDGFGNVYVLTNLNPNAMWYICNVDYSFPVNYGSAAGVAGVPPNVTQPHCQYLYSGLLTAANTQLDVTFMFDFVDTATTCTSSPTGWVGNVVPNPFPYSIKFQ